MADSNRSFLFVQHVNVLGNPIHGKTLNTHNIGNKDNGYSTFSSKDVVSQDYFIGIQRFVQIIYGNSVHSQLSLIDDVSLK